MYKLQIIIGSSRPTWAADRRAPWVIDRATAHGEFDVEVLDLRDWPLPIFSEHFGTIGDLQDPTCSEPIVKRWNQKIKDGEAYLVVTPEYNHSVPGVLKNAIDSVFVSFAFRNKPLATVGYSGGIGGGIRAVEHPAQIAVEAEVFGSLSTISPGGQPHSSKHGRPDSFSPQRFGPRRPQRP